MSGAIKGICIEFRGNATPLQKAIRTVDKELKKTSDELKGVNKALKFNPTSVDLWKQKQQLLTQRIDQTKDKLDVLRQEQKQMDAAGVDKNSEQYRKLQREIIETKSQLKHFKSELRSIGSARLKALGEQFKQAGSKIEQAGQSMREISMAAGAASAAIGAAAVKSGKWADDLNTMSKKYSMSTQELQKYSAAAELVDVDVETIANSHRKLTKQMASAQGGTGKSAEAFEKLGVSVTDADGNLRDSDTVWQETIAALGKMENETERDATAMQLMGKSASDLNPLIEDGGETYKTFAETMEKYDLSFIDQDTLDKANQFNDELDTMKSIGLVAFQELGTKLAAYLAPMLEKVVDAVGRFAKWLSGLDPKVLALIAGITGAVAVMAPFLIVIGKIATGVGALIQVIGLLAGPVGIVIAVFAALVAAGVLIYKNWDTIKAKAAQFKTFLINTFNAIKKGAVIAFKAIATAMTSPITGAIAIIRTAISKIKSIINNAHFKLPHFKLPHFRINSGTLPWGINGKGTPPKISVDWYAQGGIFNSPTLLAGIGEAGPEAVVPLDKFWGKLDALAEGGGNTYNFYITGDSPREIAQEVKKILITETKRERLAWQ